MHSCDKCGKELTLVFPEKYGRRKDDFPQCNDALVIKLNGGYGMLVDYIDEGAPLFILCKDCGLELFKNNTWMITPDSAFLENYFNMEGKS